MLAVATGLVQPAECFLRFWGIRLVTMRNFPKEQQACSNLPHVLQQSTMLQTKNFIAGEAERQKASQHLKRQSG